ncbi:iron complex transport system substrate-binding protein [Franzmannia pantelleriensis]|uniref:Iron complex transport system substrate-binding protein n=1 Tax=Franzmannia pantelleriensis TaxID=48727 RepID=A0A1G9GWG5_9GAMM|nr:ABC transporter substrate-binding protein [Halomonas pantelleriensis]SDL05008.1 iron complex transport system substrate-binding protein [Halomonas pantelleriensis]
MRAFLLVLLIGWSLGAQAQSPRTVVIGGDIAEIVTVLEADQSLVGRDDTSLYPPSLASLPSVGYLRQLSAEGVLSLRPERLVVSGQARPRETLRQLDASGVEVVTISAEPRLEEIPHKVMQVGEALDRETQATELAEQVRARVEEVAALPRLDQGPAMFLLSHAGTSPMAAGHGTAADSALSAAGIDNAFAAMPGYKVVSAEGLIAEAPSSVIVTRTGLDALGGSEALWRLPGMAMTPAGSSRRLVVCDDQALLGFGPRTPEAILALHRALASQHATADDALCGVHAS